MFNQTAQKPSNSPVTPNSNNQNIPQQPVNNIQNSNQNTGQNRANTKPTVLNNDNLATIFNQSNIDPVNFINALLRELTYFGASDIFFEPQRQNVRVRARIDGVLYDAGTLNHDVYQQIASRIKVLCNLDLTKKNVVQEGQFTAQKEQGYINLRVEIVKTSYGELIVIRVHEKDTIVMELSELGFSEQSFNNYMHILSQRSGLVLVCGPTGCGKTTTLYSTINQLNKDKKYNIMTIEDPVEFQLDGINQMQAHPDKGFTFAEGLKTILRLSPDIVLVGEIRDKETAEIAIETGLTGLMVLSTIHAEDSVGTLFRLLDLEIESYILNSAVRGIVAQRLVRKNCPSCLVPYQANNDELELFSRVMKRPPQNLKMGTGCANCNNLGYQGRIGIYEVLPIDTQVRDLIRSQVNETELRDKLYASTLASLLVDGLQKAEQGVTTVDEVLRNSLRVE